MPRALVNAAALALALALAGAACRDPRLEQLQAIRDEVCACKTVACGEEAMKHVPQDDARSGPRAQKIARSMIECLHKLYVSDRPSTDPDAEAPAASAIDPGAAATGATGVQ